jgi:alpha-tubulin suppressor-like RCC1 family protein
LGDGTTTNRLTPTNVSGLGSGVQAITAGSNHTCAITATGAARCWGSNDFGKLGDGTTTNRLTPTNVTGLA